jgi:2-methylaconitate cis-trans-isomerase PrpF
VTVRGKEVEISICDIANIMVYARATDLGISGTESARTLNENKQLIDDVRELRGRAAQLIGLCSSWEKVDDEIPNLPYVVLLSPSKDEDDGDVQGRLFLDNYCHSSMAGTGATCTTACAHIKGTLVNQMSRPLQRKLRAFKVGHPVGHLPVMVQVKTGTGIDAGRLPKFSTLSFVRTARQIAKGELCAPEDFDWDAAYVETNGGLNGH